MKKIVLCFAAAILSSRADSAPSVRGGDWPAYGHDAGGGRFSPLTEITPKNVAGLQIAWAYQLPAGDQPVARGLSYWAGDKAHAPRIIFGTTRGRLIALDTRTGAPARDFGADGVVETRTPEIMNGLPDAAYGYSAPAVIYGNLAIIGSHVQESPSKGAAGPFMIAAIAVKGRRRKGQIGNAALRIDRQHVGVVATGGSYLNSPTGGDSLVVWALPNRPGRE